MFRRRRKMNTDAAGVIDAPPQRTTVNNQAPNYAAPLVVIVAFLLLLIPVFWLILVFLFDTAGWTNPERAAANLLIYSICLLPLFGLSLFVAGKFVSNFFEHRERLAETHGEWAYKAAIASRKPVGNSRTMGNDLRFVRLVEHVMIEAYLHIEQYGQYTKKDAKPWARNQATAVVLANEQEPVGWKMGNKVRSWLQERNVLNGDIVNLDRYPDIGSIQSLLRIEFELPIQAQSPALSDGREWTNI